MTTRPGPIRVVVVDDDSAQRATLVEALRHAGDVAVLGLAVSGASAVEVVAQTQPDVVIIELRLRSGDSMQTIEQLMARTPTPILVLSAGNDGANSASAAQALVSGALAELPRPASWTPELSDQLRHTLRQLSKVPVIRHPRGNRVANIHTNLAPRPGRRPVVAIAASTGGPSALATVLAGLGDLRAPVLVVQHLHADFTAGLLDWMTRVSALPVCTASHDEIARPGHVYLAPGGRHLRLGTALHLELITAPATIHRPSADQLFESIAQQGESGVGVVLTGMGDDGARGLLAIRRAGGRTFAQDEASCAVFGMPRAAQRLGAVTDMVSLDHLAPAILRAAAGVRE